MVLSELDQIIDLAAKKLLQELSPQLAELPNEFIIAGGAIASLVHNQIWDTNAPVRDIDVFIKHIPKGTAPKTGYEEKYFEELKVEGKLNLIGMAADLHYCAMDILQRFDLNCCQVGARVNKQSGKIHPVYTQEFLQFMRTHVVELVDTTEITNPIRTCARFVDKLKQFGLGSTPANNHSLELGLSTIQYIAASFHRPKEMTLSQKTWDKLQEALPQLEPFFEFKPGEKPLTGTLLPKETPLLKKLQPIKGRGSNTVQWVYPLMQFMLGYVDKPTHMDVGRTLQTYAPHLLSVKSNNHDYDLEVVRGEAAVTEVTRQQTIERLLKDGLISQDELVRRYVATDDPLLKPYATDYLNNPTKPIPQPNKFLPQYAPDGWTILHEAAYVGALYLLPKEHLTKELLSRKTKVNSGITPQSPLQVAAEYCPQGLAQLPAEIIADPTVCPDELLQVALVPQSGRGNYHSAEATRAKACVQLLTKLPAARVTSELLKPIQTVIAIALELQLLPSVPPEKLAPHYRFIAATLEEIQAKSMENFQIQPKTQQWLRDIAQLHIQGAFASKASQKATRQQGA